MNDYKAPVDYRGQLLAVGDRVTYIDENDGTLMTGTIAFLADEQMCINSGGWLTVRKARLHRTVGKPTSVRYQAIARVMDAPESNVDDSSAVSAATEASGGVNEPEETRE